jgi:hypothetical protein
VSDEEAPVRRGLAAAAVLLLAVLAGCTDAEPEPDEPPEGEAEEGDVEEALPGGLRVGVVLPPRDTGAADEVVSAEQEIEGVASRYADDVAELRTIVPDSTPFVADVASLLVSEGYDLVCVFGRDARSVVFELAERHAATHFCAAPAEPREETPDNVLLVDVAMQELGHAVGVALAEAGGGEPVALLGAGNRAGGESFRSGLRAGVGDVPLREARGELEDLEAEIAAALDEEVAAIAVDAGPDATEVVADIDGVVLFAPTSLLPEEVEGALRWRVRWEVVLEVVLDHHLEAETEPPALLGLGDAVFAIDHGPQASPEVIEALERAMAELEQGERDPLEPPEDEDDEDDEQDGDEQDDEAVASGPGEAP